MAILRERANLSLRNMGKAIHFSAAYICALEAGDRAWNQDLIAAYLSALDRQPRDFYRVANGLSSKA